MPRPVHPAANRASAAVTLGEQRMRAIQIGARAGAHHERAEQRPRLQDTFRSPVPGKRPSRPRPRRRRARRSFNSVAAPSPAAWRRPRWKSPSAPRSGPATQRECDPPERTLCEATSSSCQFRSNPLSERTKFPASTNETSSFWPTASGSICAMGSCMSVLEGRTTSAGMRARRAAMASASAKP
jgi:hypothetical protein